jgi:hypothetical protein
VRCVPRWSGSGQEKIRAATPYPARARSSDRRCRCIRMGARRIAEPGSRCNPNVRMVGARSRSYFEVIRYCGFVAATIMVCRGRKSRNHGMALGKRTPTPSTAFPRSTSPLPWNLSSGRSTSTTRSIGPRKELRAPRSLEAQIGNPGRKFAMSRRAREHVDAFWSMIDDILNAMLFLLMGWRSWPCPPAPLYRS